MHVKRTLTRQVYYHTPARDRRGVFHSVFNGGRMCIPPGYPLQSWSQPGHDLMLSIAGSGIIQAGGRTFRIAPHDLVWSDNNQVDIVWPERPDWWEFCWVRVDSAHLDTVSQLLDVRNGPIFTPSGDDRLDEVFGRMLSLLHDRPVTLEPALHAAIGSIVASAFDARAGTGSAKDEPRLPSLAPAILDVLDIMRADYARAWKVRELADRAGCSEPQFFRLFRRVTGSTPTDWLRHERINHAKRRLAETRDQIRLIGDAVGYRDPYYFSRDFRQLVGVSPRQYRLAEHARQPRIGSDAEAD